ncbi:Druantia anti-phage system protein DruA [Desulfogranum marinum]|uniref:Druantia anti-phage system protein DruA n=1 Tax=Desulfogranum marinum TaxID=453220 RepID=UPI00374DD9E9
MDQTPVISIVKKLKPVEFRQVRKTKHEKLFNSLIGQYHYLGYTQPVGEHLKYQVFAEERPIACFIFSSAPYSILHRDRFIGWSPDALEKNRHLLAYNSRFLLLPWVKVPHLASHLLGRCAKTISADWQAYYNHPLFWLETFVDTDRLKGTCYKAANWHFLGNISGRGKYNKTQKQLTSIKAMYGLPLVGDFRERLCRG